MECCRCEKEIDEKDEDTYYYDYMSDVWCKACMDDEVNRPVRRSDDSGRLVTN